MPNAELIKKRNEFDAKQGKIMKAFDEAGPERDFMKSTVLSGKTSAERVDEIRKMNSELADLGKEIDGLVELENIELDMKRRESETKGFQFPAGTQETGEPKQRKSVGQLFIESKAYETKGVASEIPVDVKTVMTRAAGWAPESLRSGVVIDYATRPIQIIDALPMGNTSQAAYKYMEETTFTNNATERAESTGAYGESAFALTERSATVETIGVWLPVTDEQLKDQAGIQSYIDQRLTFQLRQRLDSQSMNGSGTTPYILGLLNKSGIQADTRTQPHFDEIAIAIKDIQVTGRANANLIIIHPTNWWSQSMKLMKTNEGQYVWGHPSDPGPDRIWGIQKIESDAITVNKLAIGDFANFCQLFFNGGIEMQVTNSHDTFFIYGKQAVRASVRVVMVWYRAAAFKVISNMG